jgi:hypothetical protein
VNDTAVAFDPSDTFCAPGLSALRLSKRSGHAPAYLVMAEVSPLQHKLGIHELR